MNRVRSCFVLLLSVALFSCQQPTDRGCEYFDLSSVKLLPSMFYDAQQMDKAYILKLDADRLLAPYLREAGLNPLKESYGNWENTGLDGHVGGHYLTACALMYAATGDTVMLSKVDYFVNWIKKCQDANSNGYVGGIPGGQKMWEEIAKGDIREGTFSLNGKWVPLYNIHKIFAGLRDAWIYANSETAKNVLIKLSNWFYKSTAHLSDKQLQQILISEHGGMNEVFVDVFEITKETKFLEFAKRFSDMSLLAPLTKKENKLPGMHANTQIPKVIGYKRYADVANDTLWNGAVHYFWNTVVNDMSVAIGGNSVREHFHPTDDFSSMIESEQGPESCNTYNMLKLTRLLFQSDADVKYIDYYERALYNHILSSQHPHKGGFVYFTPMRPQHYRVYSTAQNCFWCCVGSGLENHGKYGEMIYAHAQNELLVNLFIPSRLNWKEKGVVLEQHTKFPYSDISSIHIESVTDADFVLKFRVPDWTNPDSVKIWVNQKQRNVAIQNGYVEISNKWKIGDEVKMQFPMGIHVDNLPDQSNYACISYGPIVLAAKTDTVNLQGLFSDDSRMGHVAQGKQYALDKAPTIVSDQKDFSALVKPLEIEKLQFVINSNGLDSLVLQPFYSLHDARYMIYWPVYTKEELATRKNELEKIERQRLALKEKTIDEVAPGEQQPESDHFFKGNKTRSGIHQNNFWRDATGWFSYLLNDKDNKAKVLRIEYFGLDAGREFDIEMNGVLLATVSLIGDKGDRFYTVDYVVSDKIKALSKNGKHVLKFIAKKNSTAGGIYHVRLLK